MKVLVEEIVNSSLEKFNIWEIKVYLRDTPESGMWQISSKTKKKEPLELKSLCYSRYMCNYFSIGVESRVGLGFEKKRTTNAHCNKCVYVCEGLKKLMCCRGRARTLKIKECVDYVSTIDQEGNDRILFASSKN